ncbi:hypothetical protein CERSUDRAFT_119554 [Gelatoporia subvermispora B]|uniref:Uncharacterized protein n=1 Tax=Ceriporiopsis subvermispora (strain B) TaxID=914234 RepID=M2P8H5_CERS8|nr:hypothetical protein CERSUDRAFT_119554 [Gelatoporia subvermispora B]
MLLTVGTLQCRIQPLLFGHYSTHVSYLCVLTPLHFRSQSGLSPPSLPRHAPQCSKGRIYAPAQDDTEPLTRGKDVIAAGTSSDRALSIFGAYRHPRQNLPKQRSVQSQTRPLTPMVTLGALMEACLACLAPLQLSLLVSEPSFS